MNTLPEYIKVTKNQEGFHILTNEITQTYLKVGNIEINYLYSLHGHKNLEIENRLSSEQKDYLYKQFNQMGFLSEEVSLELATKKKKSDLSRIYLVKANPERFFNANKWLYTGKHLIVFQIITILTVLVGLYAGVELFKSGFDLNIIERVNTSLVIQLYLLIMLTIFVHEFAHALACYYFGCKVKEVGAMLMYLGLAFYCDVTPIYLIKERYKKVLVLLAGIFSQIVLSSIAAIAGFILQTYGYNTDLFMYYILFNLVNIFCNLFPFIKLDGYWILVQFTNITNLREKSFKFLLSFTKKKYRVFRGKFSPNKKVILLTYGLSALMGTYLIWIYSVYYLHKFSSMYFNHYSLLIVGVWSLILILHLLNKFKKYQQSLRSELNYSR
ncbi:M50 family metallopeptidase [Mesobacillus maritimus]|uniref:M50 family metallopeptidase n=1 Tax=Mesobacillus maritimus TaxID=1643336 RepID=UPI00203CCDD1|nr:M50 family metallopeptidase [Mesobacillus maritimus]MCM3670963.1 M50 family metallopeptidase [Mesobacillus maritimus]